MAERRNGEPQTHPRPDKLERVEQAYEAVRLKHAEGYTFGQIAEALHCAQSTAYKLYNLGLKEMAPVDAKTELSAIWFQLEQQYYEIMQDIASTTDATEKSRLRSNALDNLKERRRMLGGADINIVHHNASDDLAEQAKELYLSFEPDQVVRNEARARVRAGRQR